MLPIGLGSSLSAMCLSRGMRLRPNRSFATSWMLVVLTSRHHPTINSATQREEPDPHQASAQEFLPIHTPVELASNHSVLETHMRKFSDLYTIRNLNSSPL